MDDQKDQTNNHGGGGYESRDVNVTRIALIGLLSIVVLIISVVFIVQVYVVSKEKVIDEVVLRPESAALRELRAHEDEVLNSYKALNVEKGIYQIPISRAMQLEASEAYRNQNRNAGEQ